MTVRSPDLPSEDVPMLLTIEEAAAWMRIGRSKAYALAHEYLHCGGTAGLPVLRFGPGCLRVPRWALLELITTGRVVRLCDATSTREGEAVVR
jgi:hypothetical protein